MKGEISKYLPDFRLYRVVFLYKQEQKYSCLTQVNLKNLWLGESGLIISS